MFFYLLRHAEAIDHAASDGERDLTPKGVTQAQKVGRFCKRNGLKPELIVSSPFRRAERTARIAAEEFGGEVEIASFLASGMEPETAAAELKVYARLQSFMIVGHEPDFSMLIAYLLGLPSHVSLHIRKASLTLLMVSSFAPGAATLEFSLPAKLM